MAHALARSGTDLRGADTDGVFPPLFRLRPADGCHRRHRRSTSTDPLHGVVDGWSTLLTAMTFARRMSPWLLLAFTFAISAGDAIETPTWRAILSEIVDATTWVASGRLSPLLIGVTAAHYSIGLGIALLGVSYALCAHLAASPSRSSDPFGTASPAAW
jgi:hypothetical protein